MKRMLFVGFGLISMAACDKGGGSPTTPTTTTVPATPNLVGNYTFTLNASSVCTQIPANARTRTYPAVITQTGNDFAANLSSSAIYTQGVGGTVNGNSVSMRIFFAELVTSTSVLAPNLMATGNVSGGTISGTANGNIDYSNPFAGNASCNAADHRFSLTRQ